MKEHQNIAKAQELIVRVAEQCRKSMPNREYSNLSKLPYKVMTFVNSMNWRMKECANGAIILFDSNLTHPALMLVRSAMENAAITIKLADVVRNVVYKKGVTDADDEDLMRLLFGHNYSKEDQFIESDERLRAQRVGKHVKHADYYYPGFHKYYGYLCEFVHPNSDGVFSSYSVVHFEEGYTSFGPVLNPEHELYDAFTITLVLALQVYLDQITSINENLDSFRQLCDMNIVKHHCF